MPPDKVHDARIDELWHLILRAVASAYERHKLLHALVLRILAPLLERLPRVLVAPEDGDRDLSFAVAHELLRGQHVQLLLGQRARAVRDEVQEHARSILRHSRLQNRLDELGGDGVGVAVALLQNVAHRLLLGNEREEALAHRCLAQESLEGSDDGDAHGVLPLHIEKSQRRVEDHDPSQRLWVVNRRLHTSTASDAVADSERLIPDNLLNEVLDLVGPRVEVVPRPERVRHVCERSLAHSSVLLRTLRRIFEVRVQVPRELSVDTVHALRVGFVRVAISDEVEGKDAEACLGQLRRVLAPVVSVASEAMDEHQRRPACVLLPSALVPDVVSLPVPELGWQAR
mmetsp:Transcript_47971/g.113581  ORF Transcript_47971/g.113581 Transcript_47971/m.113581 type:complete len:343 (+) Transcript_47971:78-1106(+)